MLSGILTCSLSIHSLEVSNFTIEVAKSATFATITKIMLMLNDLVSQMGFSQNIMVVINNLAIKSAAKILDQIMDLFLKIISFSFEEVVGCQRLELFMVNFASVTHDPMPYYRASWEEFMLFVMDMDHKAISQECMPVPPFMELIMH